MINQETLDIIEDLVCRLAPSFARGMHTIEDMKQEARMMALKALPLYNETRGSVRSFLYSHIRKRLINFNRDNHKRNDPPCRNCYLAYEGAAIKHDDGKFCAKFLRWQKNNNLKHNVNSPVCIEIIDDEKEKNTKAAANIIENAITAELLEKIDKHLPAEYRATYLQLKEGVSVPKVRREQAQKEIRRILYG